MDREDKLDRTERPKDLVFVPANNWGAGDWQDRDGNVWVERNGRWENWGRNG